TILRSRSAGKAYSSRRPTRAARKGPDPMTPSSFTINTGDPARDQQELARCQATYQAQGMQVFVTPAPTGGFQVTISPPGAAPGAQPAGQLGGTMIMNAHPPAAAKPQPTAADGAPPGAVGQPQAYGAPQYGAPQQQYGAPQQ